MDWEAGQRRLDHYNKWLMDPKRPIDSVYPGYPGDTNKNDSYLDTQAERKVVTKVVALSDKVSHNENTEKLKGNMMSKVTNLSRAIDIVRANPDKQVALAAIVETLGVKRPNAFVYFTKAVKALGTDAPAKASKVEKVVVERAAKTARARKVNPVTETSPAKAAAKLAEIDKVIAGLKASGATVASPFAGL